jgi:hypothetical protein
MGDEERMPRVTADPGGRNLVEGADRGAPGVPRPGGLPEDAVVPEGAADETSAAGPLRYEGVPNATNPGAHGPGEDPAPAAP